MHRLWVMIICFCVWYACSDRERANPFDPLNPNTHGAPTGLTLRAYRDSVWVSWEPMVVDDLKEYVILGAKNSADLQPLVRLSGASCSYLFTGLSYDEWYYFAVQAITSYNEGPPSEPVRIMPGPVNLLIADYWDYTLKRVAYDGSRVYAIIPVVAPTGVAADRGSGRIYVTSYWLQRLLILRRDFSLLEEVEIEGKPVGLAYDEQRGLVLILCREPNQISIYDHSGRLLTQYILDLTLSIDASLSLDTAESKVWVASLIDSRVIALDWSHNYLTQVYEGDFKITDAIVAGRGTCWLPTDTGIVKVNRDGSHQTFGPDYHVTAIDIASSEGDCFFTGHDKNGRWVVGKVDPGDGAIHLIFDGTYPQLYSLKAITGARGTGIFTVQTGTWRLLRFDAQWQLLSELRDCSGRLAYWVE